MSILVVGNGLKEKFLTIFQKSPRGDRRKKSDVSTSHFAGGGGSFSFELGLQNRKLGEKIVGSGVIRKNEKGKKTYRN